jgi:hypothetical protein
MWPRIARIAAIPEPRLAVKRLVPTLVLEAMIKVCETRVNKKLCTDSGRSSPDRRQTVQLRKHFRIQFLECLQLACRVFKLLHCGGSRACLDGSHRQPEAVLSNWTAPHLIETPRIEARGASKWVAS